jgi:hypothetical protein
VNCANSATGSGDVCLQKTTIGRGNYIKDLCEAVNNKWQCNGNSRDSATATFMRPDPDAHLRMAAGGQELTALKICLSSPLGKIKEIIVYPTGQISVYNGACVNGEDVVQAGQAEI